MQRQLGKVLRYLVGSGLALATSLSIAALTPRQWSPPITDCQYPIYVVGDQMHANLVVPAGTPGLDWRLLNLDQSPGDRPRYLLFGWGDRIFYLETPSWDQVNLWSALRALLWQNPAALLVRGHAEPPLSPGEVRRCVKLNAANARSLTQFLNNSFEQTAAGQSVLLRGSLSEGAFFAATGRYSALRTCNSWTADGLRAAQVNTPVWGGLAPAVLRQVQNGCPCQ